MSVEALLDKLNARIARDKDEGDIAYYHVLLLQLEYITKLVTAGVIACLGDESDRHKYTFEHTLVRANSLGDWVDTLNAALTGPAAQFFLPTASGILRNLTERVAEPDRRYAAVRRLNEVAQYFELDGHVAVRAPLRQFFQIGAAVRNRTRGHGAPTAEDCAFACPLLAEANALVISEIEMFKVPWAYLHRNFSGKYRVCQLLGDCSPFDYLKRTRDVALCDGVYLHLNGPIYLPLVFSDPELREILLPNGNFKSHSFEALSYVTNDVARKDGAAWSDPPGRLPASETEGRTALEPLGNTFANLPPMAIGHIPRIALEARVREELEQTDRHPIVSLTGPGGIGKTTLALAAVTAIAKSDKPPYGAILWMSARDIDLLESGPKPVTPRVVRKGDIARAAVELLEPKERQLPGFQPEVYFQTILASGAVGPTLFILDNFETLESPSDVFNWVDTHIRPPNKALITTRFRDFSGDYFIDVRGMTDEEAVRLIDQEATRLGICELLRDDYKDELIAESDGHPYVIKILLGQVAAERRAVKPERIVASADQLLTALFERTYEALTPAGQRVFLLLASWRVFLPAVAVEAVCLRPVNERFDASAALLELQRFSLVEETAPGGERERFVGVPLAAASYGRRKLEVSPFKVAVDEDRKLLMEFGAGKREDAHRGVLPRIDRFVQAVANRASEDLAALPRYVPILEYVASKVPRAYLRLAELLVEPVGEQEAAERAKGYLRKFLETADMHEKRQAWLRLAEVCHSTNDVVGEVHALSEAALLPAMTAVDIGPLANKLNNRIRDLKGRQVEDAWSPEVRLLIERVAYAMERHVAELSATDCSRLAWLYLNIRREDRARDIARIGLERDPTNEHCLNLVRKLDS
ncbi:MAG: NB-ARC domain-containing protein [Planctomycetota bacterium]